jgi:hypothetical protein
MCDLKKEGSSYPLMGIVKINAHARLTATPHLTADTCFVNPTPIIVSGNGKSG